MTTLQNGHAAESLSAAVYGFTEALNTVWGRTLQGHSHCSSTCGVLNSTHSDSAIRPPPSPVTGNHSQAIWFQCFTAWPVQKHFLTSTLHLPQWHVRLLFFVVSNVNMASRLLPSSLRQQIFMFEGYCHPPPQSSLLSAEQPNFCQSFKTANHSYCSPLDPFQIIHIFLKATGVARHPL